MERALRVISVERGYDPADFAVVAFGGAGGLHVAELTRRLGALKAIVPPDPGLLSAYGMLASPVSRETSRTVLLSADADGARSSVDATLAQLEAQARSEMLDEGVAEGHLTAELWVDARYAGQSFELRVPASDWVKRFHDAHEERYGHRRETTPVEAVTLRAIVTAPPPPLHVTRLPEAKGPVLGTSTHVAFAGERGEASRVWRSDLAAGHEFVGPFVVQEYSGTTWVPPGWRVSVDPWGCLHLTPP